MVNSLIIYTNNYNDVYPSAGVFKIFELDPSSITFDDQKSVESLEIPGQLWNTHFDSVSVTARVSIEGTFQGVDTNWNDTTFTGRPIDFIMKLRAAMKNINGTTGSYVGDTAYDSFKLVVNNYNGKTYSISNYYNANPVQFILNSMNFKHVGGEVNKVDYNLTFLEVMDIVRLG